MTAAPRRGLVLLLYGLLAAIYLLYLPHAEFALDDWFMVQKFDQARAGGGEGEWRLAVDLARNQIWGVSRLNWLSFLSVYGLYLLAGPQPWFYFFLGISIHTATALLLCITLQRLALDRRLACLAGALFLVLPTVRNPLFWFPNCSQYLFAAFWFVVYLYLLSGTLLTNRLTRHAAALQVPVLLFAVFSTDQLFALLLFAAAWMAVLWRSRALFYCAILAWVTAPSAAAFYFLVINTARLGGSIGAKFQFTPARFFENLGVLFTDYFRLLGIGSDPYYRLTALGAWGLLTLAPGILAFAALRRLPADKPHLPAGHPLLLGLGLWLAGYAPVLFLGWRELRYDYLPGLGLAIFLATLAWTVLRSRPRNAFPAAGALLIVFSAATAGAEIRQCWTPISRNMQAIKAAVRRLPDLRDHDYVVVAGTPERLGTALHFGMFLSYPSTPFIETVSGVFGLYVARDLLYDYGRLGIEHTDFFREIRPEDLGRTHLIACAPDLTCALRTILARPAGPGRYQVAPLKGYTGPRLESGRTYTREELRGLEPRLYFARVLP